MIISRENFVSRSAFEAELRQSCKNKAESFASTLTASQMSCGVLRQIVL